MNIVQKAVRYFQSNGRFTSPACSGGSSGSTSKASCSTSGHFFEYVRGPHTFIGRQLPPRLLEARLAALVAEQAEDGGWPSPYSEGWRGWVTVQNLITLRAFGKI